MGTDTVLGPRAPAATNIPVCAIVNFTVNGAAGTGEALTVNTAPPPSITVEPAVTLISGMSSSFTLTVAALFGEFATV